MRQRNTWRRLPVMFMAVGLLHMVWSFPSRYQWRESRACCASRGPSIEKQSRFPWPRSSPLNGKKSIDEDLTSLVDANVTFQFHPTILDIPSEVWDGCSSNERHASPFVKHAWLRCLEESKCASRETGWIPQHLSIKIDGEISGFVPLYIKAHSMGEFVFDNSWAEAANANGIDYYPKLLVGVPFTPATGERILLHSRVVDAYSRVEIAALRRMVALFLQQISASSNLSSVHMNFLTDQEASDIAGGLGVGAQEILEDKTVKKQASSLLKLLNYVDHDDYLRRTSLQYHWSNSNAKNGGKHYDSFDEYLSCFKSKRRITIRRERNKVQEDEDIRIHAVVGKEILKVDGLVEKMFEIYMSTVNKMLWGRQYLSLEFFQLLAKSDFVENLCFMCAKRKSTGEKLNASDIIAGTFNVVTNGVFYGRYWGCLEEVKNLHFETCYWAAIEFCISNGLDHMEPGAGGGDYKWARGFDPVLINSAHYIRDPGLRRAVRQYIEYETDTNLDLTEHLMQKSVVGSGLGK